jgi:hypothetical protein
MDMKSLVIGGQRLLDTDHDWGFDRAKFLNSSEADNCIRQLWYDKNGVEGEEQEWGFAWRGRMAEEYVVRCLRARNDVSLACAGGEQRSYPDETLRLSATPDGEISIEEGPWRGIEIKSIDPRTNRSNLPKPAHITQLQIAMELRNMTHADACPPLTEGVLLYIDASNYNDIIEFTVQGDPTILGTYAQKAAKVFRTKNVDNLDREGKRNGGCTYCPHKVTCGVTLDGPQTRQRVRRGSNLDAAAQEYMAIKEAADAASLRLDGLKEDIKSGLNGRSKIIVGNIEVSLQAVKGRETLDKKAVSAAGIDLSPFTKTGASSERLMLKRI